MGISLLVLNLVLFLFFIHLLILLLNKYLANIIFTSVAIMVSNAQSLANSLAHVFYIPTVMANHDKYLLVRYMAC